MSEKMKSAVLSRRQLLGFGGVVAVDGYVAIGKKSRSTKRPRWNNERLYHGPMRLSQRIIDLAAQGRLCKTSARHPVIRINDNGISYLFRTFGGNTYLGELVRTEQGALRVHVWSIIDCPSARSLDDLIAYHVHDIDSYQQKDKNLDELDELQDRI